MRSTIRFPHAVRRRRVLPLVVAAVALGGCLGAPQIEDRWTRVDLENSNLVPLQAVATGTPLTISGRANITYRRILTGVVVAELRASSTLLSSAAAIRPDAERVPMAQAIEQILQNSVSLGRDARPVTGWDHLIQPFDFSFSAVPPAVVDSAGVPMGATTGLFLLCYLGTGTQLRLANGTDSLVVTPMGYSQYQVLPVGMALTPS